MRLFFLGTAAAEGFPGIFCKCERCREARKLGGRNFGGVKAAPPDALTAKDRPAFPDGSAGIALSLGTVVCVEHSLAQ